MVHNGVRRKNGFQHTAARRRLGICIFVDTHIKMFQHTAARRRLGPTLRRYRLTA